MKKSIFQIVNVIIIATTAWAAIGCSDDDSGGSVNLSVTSSGNNAINTGGRIGGRTKASVVITDFQISIRDVVFKLPDDGIGVDDDTLDVGFRGPFQLDLLNGGDALAQTIGSAVVPNGNYQEVRFKFHKSEEVAASNPLHDKSIFIAGTIDGVPFEMWHDTSENLDVGRSTGVVVDNNVVNLSVSFNIEQFFNSEVAIDISIAGDGDGNGLIEINPNDNDGNREIAENLKRNIKAAADLLN